MRRLYDSTKSPSNPYLPPSTQSPSAAMDLRYPRVDGMRWNRRTTCQRRWTASSESGDGEQFASLTVDHGLNNVMSRELRGE